jgi:hypothetical protein
VPDIQQAKRAARERVWSALEEAAVVEPGVHGHIPDFTGAERATRPTPEKYIVESKVRSEQP